MRKVSFFIAVSSGILLALAFPSSFFGWKLLGLPWLAWGSFVPLLFILQQQSLTKVFVYSFSVGIGFGSICLSWIYIALSVHAGFSKLASLGCAGFVILLIALSFASSFWSAFYINRRLRAPLILTLPLGWITFEYIIQWIPFGGFPWLNLGYSQYHLLYLIQSADIFGVLWISFLIVLINVLLFETLQCFLTHNRQLAFKRIVLGAGIIAIHLVYGVIRVHTLSSGQPGESLKLALVSGDISQEEKWDPKFSQSILKKYRKLFYEAVSQNPDLIIWPETALPYYLNRDLKQIPNHVVPTSSIPLLLGAMKADPENTAKRWNSVFLIKQGQVQQAYDKFHPVPLTEASIQQGNEFNLFKLNGHFFGTQICYEDLFPALSRRWVRSGARFIVNVSNDAWYADTAGVLQHQMHSVFRAIENRVAYVRAANKGFSAIIGPSGNIIHEKQGTISTAKHFAIYTYLGDWPVKLALLFYFSLLFWSFFRETLKDFVRIDLAFFPKKVLRIFFSLLPFSLIFISFAAFSQAIPEPSQSSGGGYNSYTPFQFYSNGEAVDLATGNLLLNFTDLSLPGKGDMDLNIIRTFNSSKSLDQTDVEIDNEIYTGYSDMPNRYHYQWGENLNNNYVCAFLKRHYSSFFDGSCGVENGAYVDQFGFDDLREGLSNIEVGNAALDNLYDRREVNAEQTIYPFGTIRSNGDNLKWIPPNNFWLFSASRYVGAVVFRNINRFAKEGDAIIALIRQDGGLEYFDKEGKPFGVTDGNSAKLSFYSGEQAVTAITGAVDDIRGQLDGLLASELNGIDLVHNNSHEIAFNRVVYTGPDNRTYTFSLARQQILYSKLYARNFKEMRDSDTICDENGCYQNYDRDIDHYYDPVPVHEYRALIGNIPNWEISFLPIAEERNEYNNAITYDYPNLEYPHNYSVRISDTLGRQINLSYQSDNLIRLQASGGRQWLYYHNGDGQIRRVIDPQGNETIIRYAANESNLPLIRHWSLNQRTPDFFVELRYPTGGVLRYEAVRGRGDVALGEIITTEFPNDQTSATYYQKYISINRSVNEGIRTRIYESDGSAFNYIYSYPSLLAADNENNTPLLIRRELNPGQANTIVDEYEWEIIVDEDKHAKVYGVKRSTTTENGASYSTANTYDSEGRVTGTTNALGQTSSFEYASADGVSDPALAERLKQSTRKIIRTKTNASGETDQVETIFYRTGEDICSNQAIPVTQVNRIAIRLGGQEDVIKEYCFDADGNITKETRLANPATEFHYDRGAFLTQITNESGTTNLSYNFDTGNLTHISSQEGRSLDYQYDALNRMTHVSYPNGSFIAYQYNVRHNVNGGNSENRIATDIFDSARDQHRSIARIFDGMDRLTLLRKGDQETSYAFGPNKKITDIIFPGEKRYRFNYDGLGRVVSLVFPGGKEITYSYQAQSLDSQFANKLDIRLNGHLYSTLFQDSSARVIRSLQYPQAGAAPAATRYRFDEFENLIETTTPEGLRIQNIYDQHKRLRGRIYPNGDRVDINNISNESGLLDSLVLQDSQLGVVTATFEFDDRNRVTQINYPSLSGEEFNDYQIEYENQHVSAIIAAHGRTEFSYTADGSLSAISQDIPGTQVSDSIQYGEDGFGTTYWMAYPDGTRVFYLTDEQGRVSDVRLGSASGWRVASLQYGDTGDLEAIHFGNGVSNFYTYDASGRVIRIRMEKNGEAFNQVSYTYDDWGNKSSLTYLDGSRVEYRYDGLNRIIEAKYFKPEENAPHNTQSYSYDGDGNRTVYSDAYKQIQYNYEQGLLVREQLGNQTEKVFEHDIRGNLLRERELKRGEEVFSRTFNYDFQDRLVGALVQDESGARIDLEYEYDYAGRRIAKKKNGQAERYYVYGKATDPLVELNGNGEIAKFFIYVGGRRIAAFENEQLQYFHLDEMGNVFHATNDAGNVTETLRYDPFGNVNFHVGLTDNRYRFGSKEYDKETGLIYYGARYYDPETGRFITRDPMEEGLNHYIFAKNNPMAHEEYMGMGEVGDAFEAVGDFLYDKLVQPVIDWNEREGRYGVQVSGGGGGPPNLDFTAQGAPIARISGSRPSMSRPQESPSGNVNTYDNELSVQYHGCSTIVCINVIDNGNGENKFFVQSAVFGNGGSGGLSGSVSLFIGGGSEDGFLSASSNGGSNFQGSINFLYSDYSNPINPYLLNSPTSFSGREDIFGNQSVTSMDAGLTPINVALPQSSPTFVEMPLQTPRSPFAISEVEGDFSGRGRQAPQPSTINAPLGSSQQDDTPNRYVQRITSQIPSNNTIGDPIMLYSGDLLQVETDLKIPGRDLDYELTRTYRSRLDYDGPLGFGWDHNYNKRLVELEDGSIRRFDGDARFDDYKLVDGRYIAPSGYFDRLVKNSDGTYIIRHKDGLTFYYRTDGFVSSIVDRNGNQITFSYLSINDETTLDFVTDALGRTIDYHYNGSGKLDRVVDFSGRTIRFDYDENDNLIAVHSPAVDGYPAGKVTRYYYSADHNLLTVTDPAGQIYLRNEYSTTDRVTRQYLGSHAFNFSYYRKREFYTCAGNPDPALEVSRTTVVDRNGNTKELRFNCQGNPLTVKESTRGVRPGDPSDFTTAYTYNQDGLPISATLPHGNRIEYVYESRNTGDAGLNKLFVSNLIQIRKIPDRARGGGDPLVTSYTYDPIYGQVLTNTEPGGEAYTTTRWFDYQEGASITELAQRLGTTAEVTQNLLEGVATGLGDLNNDGVTSQIGGNAVRIDSPALAGMEGTPTILINRLQYNTFGQPIAQIEPAGQRNEYRYNNEGHLTEIIKDAGGQNISNRYEYDDVGNVTVFIDGRGNRFAFSVNNLNQVIAETMPAPVGFMRRYQYDANDNLSRVDEPEGDGFISTRFEYNILNRPVARTQETGSGRTILTEYRYDPNENLTRIIQPEGNSIGIVYDERDLAYQVTLGSGSNDASIITVGYDANKNRTSLRDGKGALTNYSYDGFDRLVQVADPLENTVDYVYNPAGDLTQVTYRGPPNGQSSENVVLKDVTLVYNEIHKLVSRREAILDAGNLISNRSTQYRYDNNHRLEQIIDALDQSTTFAYDGLNRLTTKTDPESNQWVYSYDGNNNVTAVTTREVNATQGRTDAFATNVEYDALNRPVTVTDNLGHTKQYQYDARNNLVYFADSKDTSGLDNGPNSGPGNVTRYRYDGLNRLIQLIQEVRVNGAGSGSLAGQITTNYQWDDNSRLEQITDAKGKTTRFGYDALDRRTRTDLADGSVYTTIYDVNSNAIQTRDPSGFSVANIYDELNRLIRKEITLSGSLQEIESYEYDGLGRTTSAQVSDRTGLTGSVVIRAYDSLDNILRETQNGLSVVYGYDTKGRRQNLIYPSGKALAFAHDHADRLTGITDGRLGRLANISWANLDQIGSLDFLNGNYVETQHDGLKRAVQHISRFADNNVIAGFESGYDKANNRLFDKFLHTENLGNVYSYDSLSRLNQAVYLAPNPQDHIADSSSTTFRSSEIFTLDELHNWLSRTNTLPFVRGGEGGVELMSRVTTFSANDVHGYETMTTVREGGAPVSTEFAYDGNGNLVQDADHTFVYDYRNLLVEVKDRAGGDVVSAYQYDVFGRRIAKTVSGLTTAYVYDGFNVIEERTGGVVAATYTHGARLDELVAMERGEETYFYHTDPNGNVVALTNSGGEIVERYTYTAYGEVEIQDVSGALLEESATGNPYLYTGREYDSETGLYHYRLRTYHPSLGRFLQQDPLGYVDSLNTYAYVNSNPVNFVDPLGLALRGSSNNPRAGNPQGQVLRGNVVDLIGTEPQPGTVYLFTKGQLAPIIGALAPGGPHGHAAVEIGPEPITGRRRVFSAEGEGTYILYLEEALQNRSGHIFTPRVPVDIDRLTEFAEQNVGIPYGVNIIGDSPREICSSAVAACLNAGGVNLQNHGVVITPNDLSNDPVLKEQGEFDYGGWGFDQRTVDSFLNKIGDQRNQIREGINDVYQNQLR